MERKQNFQWGKLELGTCYYPEHWDKSLWESDLDRMLAHGITTIRIAEFAWSLVEPQEGQFTFAFWDEFLDLAEAKGMKVIFGTPTATPPAWLTDKYPEVLNARRDGVLYRHGMRRHYNYNSKKYQELAARVVEQLGQHYGKRPCIVGWQIDNEFNCETQQFYSESDTVAFRQFLQEKYGTLEALNQAWGAVFWDQTYTSWEQVYVPRTTYGDGVNPNQQLDYIRFVSQSATCFCRMQCDILRKYSKPGDFITTNGMFGSLDNHRLVEDCLDVYTYDSYPNFAFAMGADPRHNTTLNDRKWGKNLMEVRSVCPHFGIMEQQAGAGGSSTRSAPAPKPGQMMLWAMQSIAHGADYVSFFRWRTVTYGPEMYWHGLLDYDNRPNRKLAELQRLHARVEAIQEMAGAEYIALLGLVKDYDNVFDAQLDAWHGDLANASEMELFVASQLAHTPMDALYLDHAALEDLQRYPVLFCPHQEILTPQRAQLLEEYVRSGGTLVLGARTGQKDAQGHCVMVPMPGLLSGLTNPGAGVHLHRPGRRPRPHGVGRQAAGYGHLQRRAGDCGGGRPGAGPLWRPSLVRRRARPRGDKGRGGPGAPLWGHLHPGDGESPAGVPGRVRGLRRPGPGAPRLRGGPAPQGRPGLPGGAQLLEGAPGDCPARAHGGPGHPLRRRGPGGPWQL